MASADGGDAHIDPKNIDVALERWNHLLIEAKTGERSLLRPYVVRIPLKPVVNRKSFDHVIDSKTLVQSKAPVLLPCDALRCVGMAGPCMFSKCFVPDAANCEELTPHRKA